jgi:hypothetical protein
MDSVTARRVGEQFEALLLAPMLAPLFGTSSPLGNAGVDALATAVAQHDGGGFAAEVAARLEAVP